MVHGSVFSKTFRFKVLEHEKDFADFVSLSLLPLILVGGWSVDPGADAQIPMKDPDTIFKGMEKVISTSDGKPPLFSLWVDKKPKPGSTLNFQKTSRERNTSSP